MKIFTVEQAQKTILKRRALNRIEYAPATLERTASFFGEGITPPKAVEIILESVEAQGDNAIHEWSASLDNYSGKEISVPKSKWKQAWGQLPPELKASMNAAAKRVRQFHDQQPIHGYRQKICHL